MSEFIERCDRLEAEIQRLCVEHGVRKEKTGPSIYWDLKADNPIPIDYDHIKRHERGEPLLRQPCVITRVMDDGIKTRDGAA